MTQSRGQRALKDLLRQAKTLAVRYYAITGKPLGVTGEVADGLPVRWQLAGDARVLERGELFADAAVNPEEPRWT